MIKLIEKSNAENLVKELLLAKKELISSKKMMDKKDGHIYPIKDIPFEISENWQWVFLSDVSIIQEGPGIRTHQYQNEGIQFITVTNILEGSVDLFKSQKYLSIEEYEEKYKHYTINKGDIVTACSGATWGKSAIYDNDIPLMLNTSTLRLRFFNDLGDNKYLYYLTKSNYFKSSLASHLTGQQPNYGYSHYSKIPVPIPPLQEQKQIVAILGQAFEVIDQAKANIEKNIANAKELFQSKLNAIFSQKGDGWEEKKFSELFKLKSGDGLTAKNMVEGSIPVYGGNGIAGYHNNFNKNGKYLVIGRVGALCGNVRFLDEKFWLTDNAFQISEMKVDFDYSFLTYLLNSKDLRSFARQAAQPVISNSSLKDVCISYPNSITIQQEHSNTLVLLKAKIEEIENSYQRKLKDLEDLKKSLLQKAFAGELTNKEEIAPLRQVAEPITSYLKN